MQTENCGVGRHSFDPPLVAPTMHKHRFTRVGSLRTSALTKLYTTTGRRGSGAARCGKPGPPAGIGARAAAVSDGPRRLHTICRRTHATTGHSLAYSMILSALICRRPAAIPGALIDERIDPVALHHSITRSTRTMNESVNVSPIALADFMLRTSSYFVGPSTGRSLGLAPRRMRSTK